MLIALFAVMSAASASAYYIEIDNDADGEQATNVKAMIKSAAGWSQPLVVRSGRERKFTKLSDPVQVVWVNGTAGVGKGQEAYFAIPEDRIGRNIKIDVEIDDNGKLYLQKD